MKEKLLKLLLAGLAIYIILANVLFRLAFLTTDWWWFESLGYVAVFSKVLLTKLILFAVFFVLSTAFLLINFLAANRTKTDWSVIIPMSRNQTFTLKSRWIKKIGIFLCFLLGLFFGLGAAENYDKVLQFIYAVPFGKADPIFNYDLSFYVFSLPILAKWLFVFRNLVLFSFFICLIVYAMRRVQFFKDSNDSSWPRFHLSILAALFLLTLLGGIYLNIFGFLQHASGPIFGASYTDINLRIPLTKISIIIGFISVLTLIWYGLKRKAWPFIISICLYVLTAWVTDLAANFYQKYVVVPNELVVEKPYLKSHIDFTREAYDLNKIEEKEIAGDQELTSEDITNNSLTFKNIRLWDRAPLLSAFSQLQEMRTYYNFISIDDDRYLINNELRQLMLSPRELNVNNLPNQTWINSHLTFTHGYGLTVGPVNEVSGEGLPTLFVKDLPPQTESKELEIKRPEIYFGELSNNYVIVKTKSKELDYPQGENNIFNTYQVKSGVTLDSLIKLIFFGIRFNAPQIIISNDLTPQSQILYYRRIKERLFKIAPFLTFDRDPYLVVNNGKLYWLADGYTVTDRYPYSKPLSIKGGSDQINYIRNSVKIVIDAYTGAVNFYQADENDPIIKTYAKIFPDLIQPLSQMPKDFLAHIKYPEDIFMTQASLYATYHMNNPQSFYNKEDQWQMVSVGPSGETQEEISLGFVSPRHLIMRLPGESKEEFVFIMPFTPGGKDNLSSWMVARNDGQNYGKLLVYRFSKQKLIFGPKQIIGRINQDAEISRQLTLWDQGGSQVIYGPLLIVPVKESLVYVRPLYLQATGGKIPELKRIIIVYKDKIVMEETLEKGLSNIFGSSITKGPKEENFVSAGSKGISGDLLKQANDAYQSALQAQKNGDWTKYGLMMDNLGVILNKMVNLPLK